MPGQGPQVPRPFRSRGGAGPLSLPAAGRRQEEAVSSLDGEGPAGRFWLPLALGIFWEMVGGNHHLRGSE